VAVVASGVLLIGTLAACTPEPPPPPPPPTFDQQLATVVTMAKDLVRTGLSAGDGYPETWIRDLNTFLPLYLDANGDRSAVRSAFLTLLAFQADDGGVPDGFEPLASSSPINRQITSPLAPNYVAYKNTTESDQESSLVQAIGTYVSRTGDTMLLDEHVGVETVRQRLEQALRYLMTVRSDPTTGLVWSAVTMDWGDVQTAPWGSGWALFEPGEPRAVGIYANAMLSLAIGDYLTLPGVDQAYWSAQLTALNQGIRTHLWDGRKFRAHLYLDSSPMPANFDESQVNVHGGTAVAVLAGILTPQEVAAVLELQVADKNAAGANSIGISNWPYYPSGVFPYFMGAGDYQNGGDWDWFGARMIRGLIDNGMVSEARREIRPMIERVIRAGGFYEFWDLQGNPRGSAGYRGSAGELGLAASLLL
jgi:glycogen debranching enzyme